MEIRRTTVRDIRRANRASLLTDLFHGGLQSRQQLGGSTALSQASVSNLIGEMIDEGLVEEAGLVGSDGGRPRAMLRVAPRFGFVAGADVGERRIMVELYDLAMTRLATVTFPLDGPPDAGRIAARLIEGLAAVTAEAGVAPQRVIGFGVGVPGVVDHSGGEAVVHSQATGWDGVPLGALLRAGADVPAYVANGATTVGQAEMWFGAARGTRHAVIVLIDAGVGAAVVHGQACRSASRHAGEWGHTPLVYDGEPCRCGARGCLEAYVGSASVNRMLAEVTGRPVEPDLMVRLLDGDTALDDATASVFHRVVGHLGAGIAGLVNLFSPERIVLGGQAGAALGRRFLAEIRSAAARYALRQPYSRTRIELCVLGPGAVAMGAATLPVARLLAAGGLPESAGIAPVTLSRAAYRRQVGRGRP